MPSAFVQFLENCHAICIVIFIMKCLKSIVTLWNDWNLYASITQFNKEWLKLLCLYFNTQFKWVFIAAKYVMCHILHCTFNTAKLVIMGTFVQWVIRKTLHVSASISLRRSYTEHGSFCTMAAHCGSWLLLLFIYHTRLSTRLL